MMKLSIRKATNTLWDVHNCAYRMVKVTLNCDQCTFPPFRSRSSVMKSLIPRPSRNRTQLSSPAKEMLPSLFPQLRSAVAAIQIFNTLRHLWLRCAGVAVFLEQPSHPSRSSAFESRGRGLTSKPVLKDSRPLCDKQFQNAAVQKGTDFNTYTWPAASSFNYFNNNSFNNFDDSNRYRRHNALQSQIVVLDYILRTRTDAIYTGTIQETTWRNFIYSWFSVWILALNGITVKW